MIGVDVGGTKVLAGAVDEGLQVVSRVQRLVASARSSTAVLDLVAAAVGEAAEGEPIAGVGVGLPALIDAADGVALASMHLPLAGVRVRDELSARLAGVPVSVDNDANLALLAEHRAGAAQGASVAVMLTLGTGIGGGIVIDGRPFRGATGAGAELGHIVVDAEGPDCPGACPNRGCLEALASGTALGAAARASAVTRPESALARALAMDRGELPGVVVTRLARDGDELAVELVAETGRWLGLGLCGLVNAFDPEVVVVGGGMMAAGELLLGPAREVVRARALAPLGERVRVEAARFGEQAGMLGAALLARDAVAA